jgi:hypothetical protein
LQKSDFAAVARVNTAPPLETEVERHLREYVLYVLERDVRSVRFIETLRRTRRRPAAVDSTLGDGVL